MVFLLYARRRAVSCTAEHFCLHAAVYQCGFQNNKTKEPLVRMRLERGLSNIGAFLAAWLHSQIRSLCYLCVLRFFFPFFCHPLLSVPAFVCHGLCVTVRQTHTEQTRGETGYLSWLVMLLYVRQKGFQQVLITLKLCFWLLSVVLQALCRVFWYLFLSPDLWELCAFYEWTCCWRSWALFSDSRPDWSGVLLRVSFSQSERGRLQTSG